MRLPVRWLGWLCLSLMFWTAVAESTHVHANQTESASCSICVAAHSTAPAPVCHHLAPIFAAIDRISEEKVTAKAQLEFFKLGIRGPPEI